MVYEVCWNLLFSDQLGMVYFLSRDRPDRNCLCIDLEAGQFSSNTRAYA